MTTWFYLYSKYSHSLFKLSTKLFSYIINSEEYNFVSCFFLDLCLQLLNNGEYLSSLY